jgi:hypothetical protein
MDHFGMQCGPVSALGCVRCCFDWAGIYRADGLCRLALAALAFALELHFFPFGTIFFDHNLTAVFSPRGFYLLCARKEGEPVKPKLHLFVLGWLELQRSRTVAAPAEAAVGLCVAGPRKGFGKVLN